MSGGQPKIGRATASPVVPYNSAMTWTVYLARCADGSLYAGITTDPLRRLSEHNSGAGAAYTRSRLPVTLVYCEEAGDRAGALRREHAIRRLTRSEKEALVLRGGGRPPFALPHTGAAGAPGEAGARG